jgi:hypothetical protein
MYPTSRGALGAGERIDSNSLISLYTRIFLQKRDAPLKSLANRSSPLA